jgi:hypothetical protein
LQYFQLFSLFSLDASAGHAAYFAIFLFRLYAGLFWARSFSKFFNILITKETNEEVYIPLSISEPILQENIFSSFKYLNEDE